MKYAATIENESLGFLLVTAARLLQARFESALSGAEINIATGEARTLAVAARLGPVKQANLAAYLRLDPMTLVGHLDRLEGRELITRVVDPNDRRSKLVCLTSSAGPHLKQIRRVLDQVQRKVTTTFSDAELTTFRSYLDRLGHSLGAEPTRLPAAIRKTSSA